MGALPLKFPLRLCSSALCSPASWPGFALLRRLRRRAPAPNVHTGSVYVPDEVIVRYAPSADRKVRAAAQRGTGTGEPHVFAPRTRVLKIRDGESVAQTIAELERRPGVLSATPNVIAHISRLRPQRPGPARQPARRLAGRCSGTSGPTSASTRPPRGTG